MLLDVTPFDSWDLLAGHLAGRAHAILGQALEQRGRAVLALSGGRTPDRYLPLLRSLPLDWGQAAVTLTDERFVPTDHSDSNEALVRRHGFAPVLGLRGTAEHAADAAAEASARLSALPLPWDLAIFGVGEDGHIASLFPDTPPIPAEAPVCVATRAPDGRDRLSLSPAALTRFAHPILVIGGAAKRRLLDRAERDRLPVRLLLAQPRLEILHCTAEG